MKQPSVAAFVHDADVLLPKLRDEVLAGAWQGGKGKVRIIMSPNAAN